MCQLLETIKLLDGEFYNLERHNQRLNAAREELFPGCESIDLKEHLRAPAEATTGLFRCRVLYSREIESIQYIPQASRTFERLKLVHCDEIDYHLKYANRELLNDLYAQRENADEIIIVRKGEVTDCSIANLVFFDGREWHTPLHPLLRGTQRQKLLDEGLISECLIMEKDLQKYQKVGLINAFFDLDNLPQIKFEHVF